MEQLQALKRKLSIPAFPFINLTGNIIFGVYQVSMLATALSLILTLWTGSTFWIYLINGLLFPLTVSHYCGPLEHYWEWFAVLLLVRQLSRVLVVLDAVLLICLWHPKIKWGCLLTEKVESFWQSKAK